MLALRSAFPRGRWGLAALLALTACVGPARTLDVYEGKAVETAAAVLSAVQTARLVATAAGGRKVTAAYASVVLGEAERSAGSAQAAFASIQPPGARADRLARGLQPLVQAASTVLRTLRIATRRGELARLQRIAEPLKEISFTLDRFVREHE